MKVLFMPLPAIGHTFPMVPLAWALRAAGHQVTFLSGLDAVAVRNAGFPVIDPGPAGMGQDAMSGALKGNPALFSSPVHLSAAEILALKPVLVGLWDGRHDGLVAEARRADPDLIVFDPVFNAGLVAAAVLDVPAVGHNYMLQRYSPEFVREHAPAAFDRHEVDLPKRTALLDIGPPSLMEDGPSTWAMRNIPFNGGGVLPSWLLEPQRRPRIAISLGSPLPHRTGNDRFTHILEAARAVPEAEFALTLSPDAAALLGPLPQNVRVTGWVPLHRLLDTCAALIHHGGAGTALTACAAGIPQLIIPQGADYSYNARALHGHGCALVGASGRVDAALIGALLSRPGLRSAARELRREMEQMPVPPALVEEITEFARS